MFDRRAQEADDSCGCEGDHGGDDDDDENTNINIKRNKQHVRGYFETYHYTLVPKNMEQGNNNGDSKERSGEIEKDGKDEMKWKTMTLLGFSDDEKPDGEKASASGPVDTISLSYRAETANSTGLGVWAGAELLARFLVERSPHGKHRRRPPNLHERAGPTDPPSASTRSDGPASAASLPCCVATTSAAAVVPFPLSPLLSLQNRHCVELGAGVGLCGLVAHIWLGAKHVTLTDGDSVVLRNLRHNVRTNCVADNNNNNSGRGRIDCRQLIWGRRRAVQFLKDYHRHLDESASVRNSVSGPSRGRRRNEIQVVMASDCIYMVPSVVPFWETVATLLSPTIPDDSVDGEQGGVAYEGNEDDGINDDKIFIYVNVAASQAPLAKVLQTAMDHGLEWQEEQVPPSQVYIFRRRRGGTATQMRSDEATEDCAPHIPAGPPDAAAPCSDSGARLSSHPMMYPHDDVTVSNANSRPQNMHSHHRLRRN